MTCISKLENQQSLYVQKVGIINKTKRPLEYKMYITMNLNKQFFRCVTKNLFVKSINIH